MALFVLVHGSGSGGRPVVDLAIGYRARLIAANEVAKPLNELAR